MKKLLLCAAAGAIALASPAAHAGTADGKIQVKLLGSAVLADGKVKSIPVDLINLPAGTDTDASDNGVPTLAVEYFFTPNVSVETICCVTNHQVDGAGAVDGVGRLVEDLLILPATVTVKYHLPLGPIKPYIGAGPAWFLMLDYKAGVAANNLGATRAKVDHKFGAALQAGVDIPIGSKGFGFSLDAKRYFVEPTAHFYTAAGVEALRTKHKLDPWVLSAGIAYRF